MLICNVTEEQRIYSNYQMKYNWGQRRSGGNGTKDQQLTGVIGQTVFADLTEQPRPDGRYGPDNGVDFVIDGKTIDIKTTKPQLYTLKDMKPYYSFNVKVAQRIFNTNYYVFASYFKNDEQLVIWGAISKYDFAKKSICHYKGEQMGQSDKKWSDNVDSIRINQLTPINSIDDIYKIIV